MTSLTLLFIPKGLRNVYQRRVEHFSKLRRYSAFLLPRHHLNIDVLKTCSEELGRCVGRIIPPAFVYRREELSFGACPPVSFNPLLHIPYHPFRRISARHSHTLIRAYYIVQLGRHGARTTSIIEYDKWAAELG